jgi:flagellar biosynthesis/type III secretory pathway protein FliH
MAGNLLAPHADRFLHSLECLASYQQNIADRASSHMLKLSVAIAERIMGSDAYVTVADFQELRHPLIEAICKRYELRLRYHPQDLSNLRQLMETNGKIQLRMGGGLSIAEDANIPQGAMINDRKTEQNPSIHDQVQPILQRLLKKAEQAR